jgi:hypothetical protein
VVPQPRVYNEELLRDAKTNIYSSEHMAWLRPPINGRTDAWGEYNINDTSNPNSPYIRVTLPDNTVISATDGRVFTINSDGTLKSTINGPASTPIKPEIDRATGIYTYTYTTGAENYIGQLIVDYSAGIVRFTKDLPPKTKVYAEYTPQARRMTRGPEQDSSPTMFIEKTAMDYKSAPYACANPGYVAPSSSYKGPRPIDRMWLFWRKPNTSGVQASTIYYKTYRLTAILPKPIDMGLNGRPAHNVTIEGTTYPCEISADGTRVYFTEADERYPSLGTVPPNEINITYRPRGESNDLTIKLDTIIWQEELPETALPTRLRVNEGQVSAFADPLSRTTKIWVFWSSTRAGESDLYYQTISPNFRAQAF